jgi:hypothetical protein
MATGHVLRLYPIIGIDGRFERLQPTPRVCLLCVRGWLDGLHAPG